MEVRTLCPNIPQILLQHQKKEFIKIRNEGWAYLWSLKQLKDVSYFKLNNEINRPVNGQIPLNKDKEALTAFFLRKMLNLNTMTFATAMDKNQLFDHS